MFAIVAVILCLEGFSGFVDTLHIIPGVCITTSPRAVLHGIPFTSCVKKCDNWEYCNFLSYRRAGHVCSLFSDVPSSSYDQSCHGNVFHIKTNVVANGTDVFCSDIITDTNTVVKGNVHSIGSKRILECEPTFAMVGNATTVCEPTGQWSDFGTCVRACDKPEPTANMTFTDVELASPSGNLTQTTWSSANVDTHVYEYTQVTISCGARTRRVGPETIQCLAGYWTTMPACRQSTMRLPCLQNSDCVDLNSECRNGLCWCIPLMSHDPTSVGCVHPCPGGYGETFQLFIGYVMPGNDQTGLTITREACKQYCLDVSDASYMCKSMDYNKVTGACFPNSNLQVGVGQYADYDYYLRDCA